MVKGKGKLHKCIYLYVHSVHYNPFPRSLTSVDVRYTLQRILVLYAGVVRRQ